MSTSTTTTNGSTPFTVCVFCGANPGASAQYQQAAKDLAALFHKNGWSLVYGGGTVGLMGTLSSTLVSFSGPTSVHGIIPRPLIRFEQSGEVPPVEKFGPTTVVDNMHARKAMMGRLSNAFIALPGGFGTLEELAEIVTWNQLGIHDCPIVLLNVDGFYDGLLAWIRKATHEGFIKASMEGIIVEAKSVDEVTEAIRAYKPASGRFDLDWKSEGKD